MKLLEAIESDQVSSQRDMARKLNVSLGLVNSFIKRLAHKGYFKITTIPKNRIKYILTPKGAAEKTRLTYLYIQHSLGFYKSARLKLREVFQTFLKEGIARIVFYGATDLAEIAYLSLKETPIELLAVVDDHKAGQRFVWGDVKEPAILFSMAFDMILITLPGAQDQVIYHLTESGISGEKIATIR